VITSPTGAAVQDVIRIIKLKNPATKVVISPAQVQGEGAAEDLTRALNEVNKWGKADVIIIGRGGGSTEDLWAFNDENLARTIAASKTPTISAVGHETDFTIADFVADKRAPTPTAAAQMAVYDHAQTMEYVMYQREELTKNILDCINTRRDHAKNLLNLLNSQAKNRISKEWQNLTHLETLLEKVSPYTAFKRGYALIKSENEAVVTSAQNLSAGQKLSLLWADGSAIAKVERVEHNARKKEDNL